MKTDLNLSSRPRRNRKNAPIRSMLAETHLSHEHLVYPVFFEAGDRNQETSIKTLPGISRFSESSLLQEIENCLKLNIQSFALFPKIDDSLKNSMASEALNENGLVPRMIKKIKQTFPEAILFSDIALDPFSSDGHDGLVRGNEILNDETVQILAEMSVVHAASGVDYVSPSDMMDGRIGFIRESLEETGYKNTGIMAYSAKYCSSFYGPFREALDSAPRGGDKKTYQMDFRNIKEALTEVALDIEEGADIVMVKPGLPYLDVIQLIHQNFTTPVAAYNVSGEYAMIKFAAQAGALNEAQAIHETLTSFRRAGASAIFTYFAKQWALNQIKSL